MPQPAETEPAVVIEAISYSPVAPDRADEDVWAECVAGDDLDEPVRRRFTRYMLRCHRGEEQDFSEVSFTDSEDGQYLKRQLSRIRPMPIDKQSAERRKTTQELSNRLCAKMKAWGGNPVAGAIFIIQARIEAKTFIALIKLDLGRAEVVALKPARADRHLFSEVFERALPEDAKKLRKGVLFPSPGKGDARSGQFDAFAEYWQEFVGAQPVREAKRATEAILKTTQESLREEGKPFTEAVVAKVMDKVRALGTHEPLDVARAIRTAASLEKRPANIAEKLSGHAGTARFEETAPVESYIYKFRQGMTLKVPFSLVKRELVTVNQEGDDVVIRIRESHIERNEVIGRPK